MSKLRFDELLSQELAAIISRELEFPEALVTVLYVNCSSDQRYASVGVSVLPEKFTGSALTALRKASAGMAKKLQAKTKMREVPKLSWVFDPTEKDASKIENLLRKISEGREDEITDDDYGF
ncbi:MAG: 30S ribosome-binding factor RbfA [Patescibacteria group bacterium]